MKHNAAIVTLLLSAATAQAGLSDYPMSDTLPVGQVAGRLDAAYRQTVEAPMTLTVHVLFRGQSASLGAGAVWAEIDADRMAAERKRLDIARRVVSRKEADDSEMGLQRADIEARIREDEAALKAIEGADNSPLDEVQDGAALKKRIGERNAEAKVALARNITLLKAKLSSLSAERTDELAGQKAELELREIESRKAQSFSLLSMPCAGTVTLLPKAREDGTYRVQAGEPFATIEDKSRYTVAVPASAGKWRTLPKAGLTLSLRTGTGEVVKARWKDAASAKWYGRDEQCYIFEVEGAGDSAGALAGGTVVAEAEYKLPKPAHIVNKLRLNAEVAAELAKRKAAGDTKGVPAHADWRTLVNWLWPNAKVIADGSTHIAVAE